jgi:hypothetical protein
MTDPMRAYKPLVSDFQGAARRAQDLVLAAQAIESRVSSLSSSASPTTVRETVMLVRASAGQMLGMLLELVAHGERMNLAAAVEESTQNDP